MILNRNPGSVKKKRWQGKSKWLIFTLPAFFHAGRVDYK